MKVQKKKKPRKVLGIVGDNERPETVKIPGEVNQLLVRNLSVSCALRGPKIEGSPALDVLVT